MSLIFRLSYNRDGFSGCHLGRAGVSYDYIIYVHDKRAVHVKEVEFDEL